MSIVEVYFKYREREKQGYEFTPIRELCLDLRSAMSTQQYASMVRRERREATHDK